MTVHPLARVKRQPVTCVWEITRVCNLRCIHCENFGGPKGKAELTFEEMLRVIESLHNLGCKVVDVTGGEPLLHPRWADVVRAISDAGMHTALITNGLLLDAERLDQALEAGVGIAAFSLDGPKTVHDAIRKRPGLLGGPSPFETTLANIRHAVPRIKTTVITQVNRLNLHHLPALHDILCDAGVAKWQLQLAIPTGRVLESPKPLILAPEDLDALTAFMVEAFARDGGPHIDTSDTIGYYTKREATLRKRVTGQGIWLGCQGGVRAVAITYDGRVRGCSILPPEFDAGDLHNETLEEIWRDESRFGFSTAFDPQKLQGDCRQCRYGAICRAGCTAMAYYTTGTIYTNPYCISRPGVIDTGCKATVSRQRSAIK